MAFEWAHGTYLDRRSFSIHGLSTSLSASSGEPDEEQHYHNFMGVCVRILSQTARNRGVTSWHFIMGTMMGESVCCVEVRV